MSFQDTYSQLPPGLDPSNLARIAQAGRELGIRSSQAQDAEMPEDPPPLPKPPQQPGQEDPQQQADAGQDPAADPAAEQPEQPSADPSANPDAPPTTEPPAPTPEETAAARPVQLASLQTHPQIHPQTGRAMVPQLARRNDPYIPVQPRPYNELGQDWWPIQAFALNPDMAYGPFMPSPLEVYGIIRGAGAQMARLGAPSYGQEYGQASNYASMMGPWLDALTGGRFTKGFNAARMGTLRMQMEEMKLHTAQALEGHHKFLLGVSDILDRYTYSATDLETAKDEMRKYLQESGHENLLNMLDTRGMKGVVEYAQNEDRKYRDVLAAHTTLKHATGASDAEKDRAFEGGGGREADADSPEGRLARAGGPGAETDRGPEAPEAPGATNWGDENVDVDAELKKVSPQSTDKEIEAARQVAAGDKMPVAGKEKLARIDALARKLKDEIKKSGRAPGTQEEKLKRIQHIDPNVADRVAPLLSYDTDPEKDIPAVGNQREFYTSLAHAINPKWRSNGFKIREQYSKTHDQAARTVERIGSLTPAMNGLNYALLQVPEDRKPTIAELKKLYAGKWTGDPAYAEIYSGIQNVITEIVTIQNQGNKPPASTVNERARHMMETMSPAQIRTQLWQDAAAAYGAYRTIKTEYKKNVMQDPNAQLPFLSRENEREFRAILLTNKYTGVAPEGAPASVRAASRDPKGPRPSWLGEKDERAEPPLSEKQVIAARAQIRRMEHSEDPQDIATINKLRRKLGPIFASPEYGDPDYDYETENK